MTFDQFGLAQAFDFAGIGRWEFEPETRALVMDGQCRALFALPQTGDVDQDMVKARVHESDSERVFTALENIRSEGQVFEEVFRVARENGGMRWIRGVGRLALNGGKPRILGVSFDVTTEQELLAERDLHLAEINHRIKNLFALVSAMISSASRESETREDLVENLRGRVSALDRAHSLMLRTDTSQAVALDALLDRVLAPARSRQTILLSGDEVLIPAPMITSLVLIIHEWVTNSAKYGALRHSEGEIVVKWSRDAAGVHLTWRERVPDYDHAAEEGFGSRLLQASAMQLGATKTRRYADGWLTIDLKMPLEPPQD